MEKAKPGSKKSKQQVIEELMDKYSITPESHFIVERYVMGKLTTRQTASSYPEAKQLYRKGFSYHNVATIAYVNGQRIKHLDAWRLFLGQFAFYLP